MRTNYGGDRNRAEEARRGEARRGEARFDSIRFDSIRFDSIRRASVIDSMRGSFRAPTWRARQPPSSTRLDFHSVSR